MKIVEYNLNASDTGHGMITPGFVENGGYFMNPDDHTMVGFVPDPCEYWIPDTVDYKTLADVKARQLAIHAKYPMQKKNEEDNTEENMTDAEVETVIDEWHTAHNS